MDRTTTRNSRSRKSDASLVKTPRLPGILLKKNVVYKTGIPRGLDDFERVYQMILVAPAVTNTLTAGGIATSTTLDPYTRVDSFSRLAAVFKQYLVQKIVVATTLDRVDYSNSPMGSLYVRIEEDNSVPASTIVRSEKAIIRMTSFQDEDTNSCTSVWVPSSSEDLAWTSTSAGFAMAFLKNYANSGVTGTSASDSVTRVSNVCYYHVAFRYLAT